MGYVVILTALILIVCGALSQDDICTHEVVDDCGFQLYEPLLNPKIIPVTKPELEKYCQDLKSGRQCIVKKFDKCPNILPESTRKSYVEALGFTIDDICNNGGTQLGTKMLEHTPCVKEKLSNFTCTKESYVIIESANLEPKEEQLASLCCGFRKYERCYNDAVKDTCGLPAARSIKAIISSLGLFMVERCFPYVLNQGKCAGRILKPVPEGTKYLKSILPGLFKVLNNIDS